MPPGGGAIFVLAEWPTSKFGWFIFAPSSSSLRWAIAQSAIRFLKAATQIRSKPRTGRARLQSGHKSRREALRQCV